MPTVYQAHSITYKIQPGPLQDSLNHPHVHVEYGKYAASMKLDGSLNHGWLPWKQMREAGKMVRSHHAAFYAKWAELNLETQKRLSLNYPVHWLDRMRWWPRPFIPWWYVRSVEPLDDYRLKLKFEDADRPALIYDFKPELDRPLFKPLQNTSVFNSVGLNGASIIWRMPKGANPEDWPYGEIDFDPECLYHGREKA